MKNQTCCFTGHRNIADEDYDEMAKRLEDEIINLIQQGVIYFGAGGAVGFDTTAAKIVLRLKNKYPQVKLILIIPCLSQTKGWNEIDLGAYNVILEHADKIVYTSKEYYNGCMHTRNRHLVNNSAYCISYLTQSKGGTAYTVNYALDHGLTAINVAP